MKRLLIGLIALSSVSAFARTTCWVDNYGLGYLKQFSNASFSECMEELTEETIKNKKEGKKIFLRMRHVDLGDENILIKIEE